MPFNPLFWSRTSGRKFRNVETGETISRRQYDKLSGRISGSYEKKAAENRKKAPEKSATRPARGRTRHYIHENRAALIKKARADARKKEREEAAKKARAAQKALIKSASRTKTAHGYRIAVPLETDAIESARADAQKAGGFFTYAVGAIFDSGSYIWHEEGARLISTRWRSKDTTVLKAAIKKRQIRYHAPNDKIVTALIQFSRPHLTKPPRAVKSKKKTRKSRRRK